MKVALLGDPGSCSSLGELLAVALRGSGLHAQVVIGEPSGEGLILLMGLDGAHADDVRPDRLLRDDLDARDVAYQVLYGSGHERLAQAVQVIRSRLASKAPAGDTERHEPPRIKSQKPGPWVWSCDKCSDPRCEHLLLSSLLAHRDKAVIEQSP